MRAVVGVDLGGTHVRAGAYFEDGSEAGPRFEEPSNAQSGTQAVVESSAKVIEWAISSSNGHIAAIGMAVPGHIDSEAGVVVWAPNFGETVNGIFRYWEHVPLGPMLAERLKRPVLLGNDANLAALGEYRFGSGKNSVACLVMLTIGTGIGGGVIFGHGSLVGKYDSPLMLVGGNKGGAELGHSTLLHGGLDCNAGSYGALEAYCQRDAIVQRAIHRLRRGRESTILDRANGDLARVTPLTIFEAAKAGDELAVEVFQEIGQWLGVGIGSYINIFSPTIVAVGGQIAKAGDLLLEPARKTARNVAIPSLFRDCRIIQAEQLEDAGILGGAALALSSTA